MEHSGILTCSEKNVTSEGITIHSFPMELDLEENSMNATANDGLAPLEESSICSNHFTDEDFNVTETGYRCLKPDVSLSENIPSDTLSSLSNSTVSSDSTLSELILEQNDDNDVTRTIEELQLQGTFPFPSTVLPGSNEELEILKQFCRGTNFSGSSKRRKPQLQLFRRPNDNGTPRKRKQTDPVQIGENLIKRQKIQIVKIQGQNRRLRKKIKLIEAVIEEIKNFTIRN